MIGLYLYIASIYTHSHMIGQYLVFIQTPTCCPLLFHELQLLLIFVQYRMYSHHVVWQGTFTFNKKSLKIPRG